MNSGARDDERLRRAFADLVDNAEDERSCPSPEQLVASAANELEPERNEAVIDHLGQCASCSTAWWIAREMEGRPAAESAAPSRSGPTDRRRRSRYRRWLSVAAAAVLVVAIGLTGYRLLGPGKETSPVFRVQHDEGIASKLADDELLTRENCVLRWRGGPEGTAYDVTVTDEDLEILATATMIEQTEFQVPPEVLATLPSGARLLWRVTAHTPDGHEVASGTFVNSID